MFRQPLIDVSLLDMAEKEFPDLMRHPTNREDALQELALAQWATGGVDAIQAARDALAWLRYDLGLVPERPAAIRPDYLSPEFVKGTILDQADAIAA